MASYTSPTADEIETLIGANTAVFAQTDPEQDAFLETLRGYAEAEVSSRIGSANWASTALTDPQVKQMQLVVSYTVAQRYLARVKLQKLTGTTEPLLMEEAAAIDEAIRDFGLWAGNLIAALVDELNGGTAELGDIETGSLTLPFAERAPYSIYTEDLTYGL